MAQTPFEIIAQPFTVWIAPTGESFPGVGDAPAGNWTKIGTSGDRNYSEDGVTVTPAQTVEIFRALGSTGPRKAFRTEEELRISFAVADLTLEQVKHALNQNTVTTVAPGVNPGYKKIGLSRGLTVQQRALLIRGQESPYGEGAADDWDLQFEVPVAVEVGEPEMVFVKGEPAMVQLEFLALEDPNAASDDERFGRLIAQNADAT